MTLTRNQAKMIAEELYKLIRKDVVSAATEVMQDETEEYLCVKDAARMLGWSVSNVYKHKDDLKCYVRLNGRLRFPKSQLHRVIQSGL